MVWERIEVSRSVMFVVGNKSAKAVKIKRLENLALYGSRHFHVLSALLQN